MIQSFDELLDEFRRNLRIPQIVAIVLGILLLYEAAALGVTFVHFLRDFTKAKVSFPSLSVPEKTSQISELHLMGVYNQALGNLPETQLQLVLQGTEVSLNEADDSRAIIAGPNSPAKSYGLRQALPGGAIVHQILPDRIILNHNGVLEELRMPLPKLVRSSPAALSLEDVGSSAPEQ